MAAFSYVLLAALLACGQTGTGDSGPKGARAVSISPAVPTVLVGQPFVLGVRLSGFDSLPLESLENIARHDAEVAVFIDSGFGFERHHAGLVPPGPPSEREVVHLRDRAATVNIGLVYDRVKATWVFPKAGLYRIKVEYATLEQRPLVSNVVQIEVSEPKGTEAEVFKALESLGWHFLATAVPEPLYPQLGVLVEQYPSSVYLHRARVHDLMARVARLQSRSKSERQAEIRSLTELATELALIESPYTASALLTLARLQSRMGDVRSSKETTARLFSDYPNVAEADAARELLGVTEK